MGTPRKKVTEVQVWKNVISVFETMFLRKEENLCYICRNNSVATVGGVIISNCGITNNRNYESLILTLIGKWFSASSML